MSHIWEPLKTADEEIRLAVLQPNTDIEASPECSLLTVSLLSNPSYEAVSYVWGDEADTLDVILDHERHAVTRNLESCLRNLRGEHKVRSLWIDAICINQRDEEEQETQIMLMRKVYAKAQRVCAYLGEASLEMEQALDKIKAIMKYRRLEESKETLENLSVADIENSRYAFTFISELIDIGAAYRQGMLDNTKHLDPFLRVLSLCRARRTSRQQDKIHGMLALSPPSFLESFRVNVKLDPAQVFQNFALTYIAHTRTLSLFNQCSLEAQSGLRLPSWAPDWSAHSLLLQCNLSRSANQHHLYGAGSKEPLEYCLFGECILRLKGVFIDMIEKLGETNGISLAEEMSGTRIDRATLLKRWLSEVGADTSSKRAARYVGGGTVGDAWWRTIFVDVMIPGPGSDKVPRRCQSSDVDEYERYLAAKRAGPHVETPIEVELFVYGGTLHRQLIVGRKGYIGFAPSDAQKGDHVYVLPGGRVPYVLRPVKDTAEQNKFQLVGECYVHGIMDGEALESGASARMKLRDSLCVEMWEGSRSDRGLGKENLRTVYVE